MEERIARLDEKLTFTNKRLDEALEIRHESNQIFIVRYPLFSPVFDQPPKINPIVGLRKIV